MQVLQSSVQQAVPATLGRRVSVVWARIPPRPPCACRNQHRRSAQTHGRAATLTRAAGAGDWTWSVFPQEPQQQQQPELSTSWQDLRRYQAYAAYVTEVNKLHRGTLQDGLHDEDGQQFSLLRCAVLIAQATQYPDLDMHDVYAQVDALAADVERQLPPAGQRYPMRVLNVLLEVLYQQKGYHGNKVDYYSPANSYINEVLRNRTGIPITLSLLFKEVAARVGLPMQGLNLPGHFMLQPCVEGLEVVVDAFAGELLFRQDAEERLSQLAGGPVHIDPLVIQAQAGVPPRLFLHRMLNNLKQIYVTTSQADSALRVIRLLRATQPDHVTDVRDEGLCLYSLGRYGEATEQLEQYLEACPQAEDAGMVTTVLQGCRALLREERLQPPQTL